MGMGGQNLTSEGKQLPNLLSSYNYKVTKSVENILVSVAAKKEVIVISDLCFLFFSH